MRGIGGCRRGEWWVYVLSVFKELFVDIFPEYDALFCVVFWYVSHVVQLTS